MGSRNLFGRNRQVMRPFTLEITAGDFAFAADHRRIAISFAAATLNSAAASPDASTSPIQMAAFDWLLGFRFLATRHVSCRSMYLQSGR
jgi:hypothetical protein